MCPKGRYISSRNSARHAWVISDSHGLRGDPSRIITPQGSMRAGHGTGGIFRAFVPRPVVQGQLGSLSHRFPGVVRCTPLAMFLSLTQSPYASSPHCMHIRVEWLGSLAQMRAHAPKVMHAHTHACPPSLKPLFNIILNLLCFHGRAKGFRRSVHPPFRLG